MRAYQDFREFLAVLDQEKQLLRITDTMKLEPDLAAAAAAATELRGSQPGAALQQRCRLLGCADCHEHPRVVGQPCLGYGVASGHGDP